MGLRNAVAGVTPGQRRGTLRSHVLFVLNLLSVWPPGVQLEQLVKISRTASAVRGTDQHAYDGKSEDPDVLLVWHPMKTGGTTLCAAMLEQPGLLDEGLRSNDTYKRLMLDYNCRLTHDEGMAMKAVTGVRYREHDLPTDGYVRLLRAVTGRAFFFLEPSYTDRSQFASWALPSFLSPESAAWTAYRHVFLIRSPLERAWSALHHFKLHTSCGLDSATEFIHLHATNQLPLRKGECKEAARIADGAFGNFYVRHLTGHADALSLAKTRLGSMEVLDLPHEDANCTKLQLLRLFEVATLEAPDDMSQLIQEQRRQRVLQEAWGWGKGQWGEPKHQEATEAPREHARDGDADADGEVSGDSREPVVQAQRVGQHEALDPASPAAQLLASRMQLDIQLYEWHLMRRQHTCQQ